METTEYFLSWSTSSHPFATDLFTSWNQTGRVYGGCSKVSKSG
jgi:hypothetical protein